MTETTAEVPRCPDCGAEIDTETYRIEFPKRETPPRAAWGTRPGETGRTPPGPPMLVFPCECGTDIEVPALKGWVPPVE